VKKLIPLLCCVSALAWADIGPKKPGPTAKKEAPKADALKSDIPKAELTADEKKKALYALGAMVAQRTPLASSALTEEELAEVLAGFSDAAMGKELREKVPEVMPKVDQFLRERQKERAEAEKVKGAAYLESQAKAAGAQKTPSGLIYIETAAGSGATPVPTDTVKVHYRGTLINGTEFDSSFKRGTPAEFPLGGVIKCWTEGLQKMKVGGKAKLVCPSDIAYGERGAPPNIPGNSVLNFEVELIEIKGKTEGQPK